MTKKNRRKAFPDVATNCECLCTWTGERLVVGTFDSNGSKKTTLLVDEYGQVKFPDEVGPIAITGLYFALNHAKPWRTLRWPRVLSLC